MGQQDLWEGNEVPQADFGLKPCLFGPGGGGGGSAAAGDAPGDAGGRWLRGHRGVAAPRRDPGRRHPPARRRRGPDRRQRHPGLGGDIGVPGGVWGQPCPLLTCPCSVLRRLPRRSPTAWPEAVPPGPQGATTPWSLHVLPRVPFCHPSATTSPWSHHPLVLPWPPKCHQPLPKCHLVSPPPLRGVPGVGDTSQHVSPCVSQCH